MHERKATHPVAVLASELRSGQGDDPEAQPVAQAAAAAAYETAGLGPEDISVAEIHDAAAPAELMLSEQLGFCRPGGAVGPVAGRRYRARRAHADQPERRAASARGTRSARPARRSSSSWPIRCAADRVSARRRARALASPKMPAAGSARTPLPPASPSWGPPGTSAAATRGQKQEGAGPSGPERATARRAAWRESQASGASARRLQGSY